MPPTVTYLNFSTNMSPCPAKLRSPRGFALACEMGAPEALALPFQWEDTNLPHHSLAFQSCRALEAGRIVCLLGLMFSGSSGK